MSLRLSLGLLAILTAAGPVAADLPAVPVPDANPLTEPKRVLGKILFWDEQLSSDDTVACGTCHRPTAGGADPRAGNHIGPLPGTFDDVVGSPGIRALDGEGHPRHDPVYGDQPQVTARTAPSIYGALWADHVFWDGRAGGRFVDPESGEVVIEAGGALESQALAPLVDPVEMGHLDRTLAEVARKLVRVAPLRLADQWPADVANALAADPTYPQLFARAFGDERITAVRIAFAIASYERTLVADQTPWDRYVAGDEAALGSVERYGWEAMQTLRCTSCHEPPLFTSNAFANIGLRRSELDTGRAGITGDDEDRGAMKIPSLRNVGLRPHLMHTGQFADLVETIGFYRNPTSLPDVDSIPGAGVYNFTLNQFNTADIAAFLRNALTDPRVATETFPFDRPRLASER